MKSRSNEAKRFKREDYILSFAVEGVTVFVTDIHRNAYIDLEVLFIIEHGMFKQYFTRRAFERALERGVQFYSSEEKFASFEKEVHGHCTRFRHFFESEIKGKESISPAVLKQFLDYAIKLCKEYTMMNIEHTDRAFILMEQNTIIKQNLTTILTLKDQIRTFMNTVLFEADGYASRLFTILNKQFPMSSSILQNLTQKELLDLFNGKRPNLEAVQKRQDIFISTYDRVEPYEGALAKEIAEKFEEKMADTNQVVGQMASRGKVSGVVKVIPVNYNKIEAMSYEINKMRKGDILVAKTTAPELIVACQKAGAIVTDMGGLLSHAAIVSREFGIPCIVGTGNATRVLVDGDEVEVDADRGVVNIIRKASPNFRNP
ncbi:hypothetical protein HYT55_02125 [Candidatus Woesearchaeota archaeon]|nr:hypothetical protein [Candidatus Woesearchaeota archaeon]